jgi:lipopolysaccharide transport system ATP-binding protein
MMAPILEIGNVSKKYRIRHSQGGYVSFRERIVSLASRSREQREDFWALKDVSFSVAQGESIGVIGRNGAGKSTLLKILSRITRPTGGRIVSRGRIASLLEVGTGFHSELTGRENVFFNGSLLGMRRREIIEKFDEIVDFSGTERFLDTQIKHYSTGMQLRLAFSVAAFLEPEVMIIDEVLAVGDAEFQRKCLGKMDSVSRQGRTILFVSHDLSAVSGLCKRVIVLKEGAMTFDGEVQKGISFYRDDYRASETFVASKPKKDGALYFKEARVCDLDGNPCSTFMYDQPVRIEFKLGINNSRDRWDLLVMILDARKRRLFALETSELKETMSVVIDAKTLVRGSYSITAYINKPNIVRIDEIDDACSFEIIDNGSLMMKHGGFDYGGVFGRGHWE